MRIPRHLAESGPRSGSVPVVEALLQSLRAEPEFADAVLGDLAEEYAFRAARDGTGAARWWYAREALRSSPHLLRSALRHLGQRGRARLLATLAAAGLAVTLVFLAWPAAQPPKRLVLDSLIINHLQPVRLPVHVLDASGRRVADSGVRYAWTSGDPVPVSPEGVVTCSVPGDAVIGASLGVLVARARVLCRPVADIRSPGMLDLVAGGPAQPAPFEAVGPEGQSVTPLLGRIEAGDSTIVALESQRLRPVGEGSTWVRTRIGDREGFSSVHVYQPVLTPVIVGPDQHVAVRVRLARGERRAWHLPAGEYYFRVLPEHYGVAMPRLAVAGASCTSLFGDAGRLMCNSRTGMSVIMRHLPDMNRASELRGTLLVWRHPVR